MDRKFRITPKFIFCLFFVALFGIATVSAAPILPQQFHGTVTVNGGIAAPVGSEIRARVDGNDRGSIITTVVGYYGGTGNFDARLTVQATEEDLSGPAVVTFYVNGVKADQQVSYAPGTSLDLALTVGSGVTPTPTTQPTTQVTTQTTTPVTTQTTSVPTSNPPSGLPSLPESFYGMVTISKASRHPSELWSRHTGLASKPEQRTRLW